MNAQAVRTNRWTLGACCAVVLAIATLVVGASPAEAGPVGLGTATSYAVLAGSTITDAGTSSVVGDVGLSPGTSIGLTQAQVAGEIHSADSDAEQAKTDLVLAYDDAAGRGPATAVVTELGGKTFLPGTYTNTTLGLTGTVTLDAGGDPDAVFVFKTTSTLITATDSAVLLIGAANPCNVYWQVADSATLGTRTDFTGTVMALNSITANDRATVQGRLLARNAAVTLDDNEITRPSCALLPAGSTTTAAPTTTTEGPTTTVAGPTTTVAGPTTTVAGPTTTVAGPTTTVAGPTTTVAGPTTTVAGPTTTVAGPTTTVAGPTTTVAGPTTTVAGPTTTVAGPTTTTEAPTTTAPVTTTEAPTTTVVEVPSTLVETSTTIVGAPVTSTTEADLTTTTAIDLTEVENRFSVPQGSTSTTTTPAITTDTLARTGSDSGRTVAIGVLSIVLGGLLVSISRRRVRFS